MSPASTIWIDSKDSLIIFNRNIIILVIDRLATRVLVIKDSALILEHELLLSNSKFLRSTSYFIIYEQY